jgi:hypothetical protein
MVALRPPIGRVLGVTVTAPPPISAVLAILPRANTGRRDEVLRSEFASGGAPGFAVSVGDTTGPGVASDPASQVEWSGFPDLRGPGWRSLPGFGLVRGNHRNTKVLGG